MGGQPDRVPGGDVQTGGASAPFMGASAGASKSFSTVWWVALVVPKVVNKLAPGAEAGKPEIDVMDVQPANPNPSGAWCSAMTPRRGLTGWTRSRN